MFWFTVHTPPLVDTLYTELPAAVLLLWISFALLVAIQKNSLPLFLLTGLLMGVLLAVLRRSNRRAILREPMPQHRDGRGHGRDHVALDGPKPHGCRRHRNLPAWVALIEHTGYCSFWNAIVG